jgi:hypothetical protein
MKNRSRSSSSTGKLVAELGVVNDHVKFHVNMSNISSVIGYTVYVTLKNRSRTFTSNRVHDQIFLALSYKQYM